MANETWWLGGARKHLALVSLYVLENNGVRHVAASLREQGFTVTEIYFKDWVNNAFEWPTRREVDLLVDLIASRGCDIVGLSVRASGYAHLAAALTREIHQRLNIPVLWGGMHPTFVPQECISLADIVCVGEAEVPMVNLMQRLSKGESPLDLESFWFSGVEGEPGGYVRNRLAPLVEDLDSLAFRDFHSHRDKFSIDGTKVKRGDPFVEDPGFQIMCSRGCPYGSCTYCSNTVLKKAYKGRGRYYRVRSPESVIRELEYGRKHFKHMARIRFDDEIFPFQDEWLEEFCRLYPGRVGLPFEVLFDARTITRERLQMLKDAGLDRIYMGVQNTEEINFKLYNRKITDEQVMEAARVIHELEIPVSYHVILDDPVATEETKRKLFNLLLDIPHPYDLYLFSLTIYPKSAVEERLKKLGLITKADVEGVATKIFSQYRVDLAFPRSPDDLFWTSLIVMVSKDFIPVKLLRQLSNSRFFRRYPRLLAGIAQVTNIIKMGLMVLELIRKREMTWLLVKRWLNLKSLITA